MTSFFLLRSRDLCIFKEGKTRSLFQSHLNMNEDLLNYDEFEIWRPFAWVSALVNAADAAGSLRPRSGSARENDTQTTSQLITSVFPGLDARSNVLYCFLAFWRNFWQETIWRVLKRNLKHCKEEDFGVHTVGSAANGNLLHGINFSSQEVSEKSG